MTPIHTNCQGFARRDFLQVGLRALGGVGLADILRLQSQAGAAAAAGNAPGSRGPVAPRDVRCIFVWLDGGPSHYETFDPKPDAPREVRGDFGTVKTTVPGVHFSEVMPHCAAAFDKFTVVRSIAHRENNHGAGNHYLTTGRPTPVPVGCGAFVTFHPSFGSVVSRERGLQRGMPPYIAAPRMSRSGGPSFLGGEHAPFVIGGNPDREGFRVRDVTLPPDLSESRANSRRELRRALDRLRRIDDRAASDPAVDFDDHYAQGLELVTSPDAQEAFDISQEPDKTRERYGRNDFGQRLLLARRLTEAGVPFVNVYSGGWDDHENLFEAYQKGKVTRLDQGLAALIGDLDDRGSLAQTLVVCLGEFGRTPKVNERGGRDHWSFAMSVLMAGAGIPGGQIVGATDVKGYYASENVYAPEDFAASIYTKLGINPAATLHDTAGRPVPLVNHGRLIKELFA